MSIASEFELLPLGDLVRFINGDRSTNYPKGNDYVEAGIPFISATDLSNGRIDKSSAKGITRAAYEKLRSGKIQADDVLFCLRGSIGKIAYVREGDAGAIASSLVIVRATEKVNARYLFFVLSSPSGQQAALGLNNGAAQPNVSVGELQKVLIPLPPVPTQHRIASILSAYDDLIENNTRRIAILEEMARRIYEEWFVHFRFPGHEQVKMVESELGLIPGGWKIQPLGELLEHHIGGGWGQENHSDDFPVAAYVIRGTDIPDARSSNLGRSPLRFHKESNFRTRKLQPGDIVFEVSGGSKDQPVGRAVLLRSKLFASADHPIICASFCRLVRANKTAILPELLQLHFERIYESREIMKYQTQSTGITNFKFTVFTEKELVLVPPQDIQKQFQSFVDSLYGLASTLGVKNTNLRTTRDLLLPKLISGELDVSNLPEFARLTDPEEAIAA